ncbi:hypothetical protein KJ966_20580 [bacterium]|nr:hypothetical protein [bacterium]
MIPTKQIFRFSGHLQWQKTDRLSVVLIMMTKFNLYFWVLLILQALLPGHSALAGTYAPAADETGSTAIYMNSDRFIGWASGWINLVYGEGVSSTFKTPEYALGAATGSSFDIVSLGRGGSITLTFDVPIRNGFGWDFAVFENAFSDTFLELAYVEVSSNGIDYVRFENHSRTPSAVGEYGSLDPTDIEGLAGKYRLGYGTPFDLGDLFLRNEVTSGILNLSAVTHIRLVDIIGDGSCVDSDGNPVYDPYPTSGSAGFDLEALGYRYESSSLSNTAPDNPELLTPIDSAIAVSSVPSLVISTFSDLDTEDFHLATRWQVTEEAGFSASSLKLEAISRTRLTQLSVPELILKGNNSYYWRALVFDSSGSKSGWSDVYQFTTSDSAENPDYILMDWDGDGTADGDILTVATTNSAGEQCYIGVAAVSNVDRMEIVRSFDISSVSSTGEDTVDNYVLGLFGFRLTVIDSEEPVVLTIYFSESAASDADWYSYDKVNGWLKSDTASFNTSRTSVTLAIEEGAYDTGDKDNVKNGIVVYKGGLVETSEKIDTDSDDGGIGERGGCLITVTQFGFPKKPIVIFLLLIALGLALTGTRSFYTGAPRIKKRR